MRDFHFITEDCFGTAGSGVDVTFKIRHTPEFTKGKIYKANDGYHLVSEQRLQGIAPGQFGVVYDEHSKICIGSGEIK
jgi:tRNA-specific 2-thiouridylase